MTTTVTPYRSTRTAARDGFGSLLRSEWTKLRTVRGWVIGLLVAGLVTVALGVLTANGTTCSVGPMPGQPVAKPCFTPLGPDGEGVSDSFYFAHRTLTGDGTLTARLTSLTGTMPNGLHTGAGRKPGVLPWSKAGIMVKQSTRQGAPYAAMMVTGSHGVRMQDNFVNDTASRSGSLSPRSPRWLRLTRSGDTVTGYESTNGTHWTKVGTALLPGSASAVQVGLFATSPPYVQTTSQSLGGASVTGGPTQATGVFDHITLQGRASNGAWRAEAVGGDDGPPGPSNQGMRQAGGQITITGSGDIAPATAGGPVAGQPIEQSLGGLFAGLIAVGVVGALFIASEYRRDLIRTTLAASPRRGRVLAAKALVIGAATFVVGAGAAVAALVICPPILRGNGAVVYSPGLLTDIRVVVGAGALLAAIAILALGIGAVLRSGAGAITTVVAVVVVPYLLSVSSVLPRGAAEWLLRITPAAGFAVTQTLPEYPQVDADYSVVNGYYPLPPVAGFGVLCAWVAVAVVLATVLLRKRDA